MVHYTPSLVAAVIAASSVESFTVVPHHIKRNSPSISLWTVNNHFQTNDAVQDFFQASKKTFEFLNNVQQEASSLNKEFSKVKQTFLNDHPELGHASDILDSMMKQQFNNLQQEYQMKDLLEIVNQIKDRDYTREVEVIDEVIRLLQRAQDNLKEKERSSSSNTSYETFEKHQLDDWDRRLMEYKFDPKAQLNDFDARLNSQKSVVDETSSQEERETPTVKTQFHYSPPKTYVMANQVSKPKPLNAPLATKKPMFLLPECKVQLKQHADADMPRSKSMFLLPESKHEIVPSLDFEGDKQVEQLFTITSFVDVQEDLSELPPLEPIDFDNHENGNADKLSEDQVIDIVCEVIETLEVQHSLRSGGFDPNQIVDAHFQEPSVEKKRNYQVNHSLRVEPSITNMDMDNGEEYLVEKKHNYEVNHSMREQSVISGEKLVNKKEAMLKAEKKSITEINHSFGADGIDDNSTDEKVEAPKAEIKGTSEVKHSLRTDPYPKKADSKKVMSTPRVDQRIASMIEEKTSDYEKVDTVHIKHNRDVIRKLQKKEIADRKESSRKEKEVKCEVKEGDEAEANVKLQDMPAMSSHSVEKEKKEEKGEFIDAKIEKKEEFVAPAYPEPPKEFKKEVIKPSTSQSENEFKTVTMNKMGAPSKPSYEGKIESLSEEDLAGPDVLRSNNMNRRTHEMRHVLAPREPRRVEVKERKIRMQRRTFKEEPRKVVEKTKPAETFSEVEDRHQRIKELEEKLFKQQMSGVATEKIQSEMNVSNPNPRSIDDDEVEKRIQRHRRIQEHEAKLNHKMVDDECEVSRDEIDKQREERHRRIRELEAKLKFAATVVEETDECEVPSEEPIVESIELSEERKREERHLRIKELEAKLKSENDECVVPPEKPFVESTQLSEERQREERHKRIQELEAKLKQESTMVEEEDVCDTPEEPVMDRQMRIRELEEKLSNAAAKRKERQARRKSLQELERQVRLELDTEGDDLLEQELEMMRLRAKMSSS
ncbi:predicted protein [Chaetoceros tenuissimus]|uniref:Uncharacterized protein n=1 Tax=Chaetoceros tenuissimus TaxID=426638 RepID=A0AAD3HFT6_9STRA|nr:predicted protein [Chaetoceros tenuissimus]